MDKPFVYVTRSLPEEVIKPYRQDLTIEMWDQETEPVNREVLLDKSSKVEGLLTMLTDAVDQSLLDQSPNLKVVANMAVGFDNIDVQTANDQGVVVTNTPDVLTDTTADLTFGLILATARRMVEANQHIKEGKWGPWSPLTLAGSDVHHKTIGIVGMGRIGEAVARRAKGFDMNILYHNRSRKKEAEEKLGAEYTSFQDLLRVSDIIVCLAPLTKETYQLFDLEAFKAMKSEAIFVNASRGTTVKEDDLYKALLDREIAAAGLDVFENEPISADHPLLSLNQVVGLPHIGSATKETRYKMMELCLDNLVGVLKGNEPLTPVK